MNIGNIVFWIALFVLAGTILWSKLFKKRYNEVFVEWYKLVNDQIIRHEPHKIIKGYHLQEKGVDKLMVPKYVSNLPLEGMHPRDAHLTTAGKPVLKILELSPNKFTNIREHSQLSEQDKKRVADFEQNAHHKLARNNEDIKKKENFLATYDQYVVEKDVEYWSENVERDLEHKHNTDEFKDKLLKIGAVVMVAFLCIGAVYMTMKETNKTTLEASKLIVGTFKEASDKTLEVQKRVAGIETEPDPEPIETNAAKPPSQGGATS